MLRKKLWYKYHVESNAIKLTIRHIWRTVIKERSLRPIITLLDPNGSYKFGDVTIEGNYYNFMKELITGYFPLKRKEG